MESQDVQQVTFKAERDRLIYNLVHTPWKALLLSTIASSLLVIGFALFFGVDISALTFVFTVLVAFSMSWLMLLVHHHYVRIINHQNSELRQLNSELDAFAHTVAHDLKSPLAAITGFMHLMHDDSQAGDYEMLESNIKMVLKGGYQAIEIVDSLLLMASSRDETISMTVVNMAAIVQRAWERHQILIDEFHPEIDWLADWPAAQGYAPWVESVWSNYLSNAIKYGGRPPKIIIGASRRADGMIECWVRDHAAGIAPEDQAGLFNAFSPTERIAGHGLGLSIVKRSVARMGGEVGVKSQPGEGSTFWFTLPPA